MTSISLIVHQPFAMVSTGSPPGPRTILALLSASASTSSPAAGLDLFDLDPDFDLKPDLKLHLLRASLASPVCYPEASRRVD
jgi:hypothetical protein